MDADRPILIAGRTGQLARALIDLAAEYNVPLVAVGRPQLDLADPASIERVATSIAPRAIINAAAYTAVDRAEAEPALAFAVNRDGAAQLAAAAARLRIPFVHLSTDYVFDGHKVSPYLEDDPLAPLSVYGQSKLAGEEAVREIYPGSLVLRTSWVYGSHGHNFVRTMLHLAATRDVVRVIDDQHGAPTAAVGSRARDPRYSDLAGGERGGRPLSRHRSRRDDVARLCGRDLRGLGAPRLSRARAGGHHHGGVPATGSAPNEFPARLQQD